MVMDLEKSQGSWIVDARDGKRYLDFYTFFATAPLGHNHPRLREAAFQAELGAIAVNKPANSDIYTTAYAEWVEAFATPRARPAYLPHLFWIDGGALAVENALKAAFDWKVRKNLERGGAEKGSKVIHFKEAFHGRSGYTLSLTNTADPRKHQYFPKFDWPRITNPKITFPLDAENLAKVEHLEKVALAQIEAAIAQDPDDIACLIIEPIQGEGGDNHFRPEFFRGAAPPGRPARVPAHLRRGPDGLRRHGQDGGPTSTSACAPTSWSSARRPSAAASPPAPAWTRWRASSRSPAASTAPGAATWWTWSAAGGSSRSCSRRAWWSTAPARASGSSRACRRSTGTSRTSPATPAAAASSAPWTWPPPALRTATVSKAQDLGMIILSTGHQGLRFRPALNLATEDLDLGVDLLRKSIQLAAESVRPHMAEGLVEVELYCDGACLGNPGPGRLGLPAAGRARPRASRRRRPAAPSPTPPTTAWSSWRPSRASGP